MTLGGGSEDRFHDPIDRNAFRFRLVIAHEAVTQDGLRHGLHVLDVRAELAARQGVALRTDHQVLAGARARPPADVIVDDAWRTALSDRGPQ